MTVLGEPLLSADPVETDVGAPRTRLAVVNTGDRPVQVGSHVHLPQANAALSFGRAAAYGRAWTSRRAPRCASSRGSRRRWTSCRSAARVVPGITLDPSGALDEDDRT